MTDALPLWSYQEVVGVDDAKPVDARDSDVTARRLRPCVLSCFRRQCAIEDCRCVVVSRRGVVATGVRLKGLVSAVASRALSGVNRCDGSRASTCAANPDRESRVGDRGSDPRVSW